MSIQSPFLVKYSLVIPEFDNDDKNGKTIKISTFIKSIHNLNGK
jgi:hypothetical protein